MTYWRLFYHMTWSTKNREPLILPRFSDSLQNSIAAKAAALGAYVYAVGGVEDHVHLVASVPPRIALTEFIRQVKGNSSHFANNDLNLPRPFRWQSEYGILSFDGKLLDRVVEYVRNQQRHHLDHTTIPVFEKVSGDDRHRPIAPENAQ